jgi:DNA replication factor GINS
VNLDELRTVQMKERKKDSLQHLRDSFYADVASYIEDLKSQRARAAEQADDPFSSPEISRLTDEIETAEEVAEAVYERRVGKVVKLASFAAADMPVDEEGMTTEERRLFDDLVDRIEQNKSTVLDTLAGNHVETGTDDDAAASPVSPTPAEPGSTEATADATDDRSTPNAAGERSAGGDADGRQTPADADGRATTGGESPESGDGGMLADAMGGGDDSAGTPADTSSTDAGGPNESGDRPDESPTETAASDGGSVTAGAGGSSVPEGDPDPTDGGGPETGDDTDRTTVRITRDVGAIFGVDEREYDLSTEDVVTLPAANAEPLLQRDAAERID